MFLRRSGAALVAAVLVIGLTPGAFAQAAASRVLTIEAIGRGGQPAYAQVFFVDPRTGRERLADISPNQPGSERITLPEQTYDVYGSVYQPTEPDGGPVTMMYRTFRLRAGHERMVLDARLGKPVTVTVDEPTATGRVEGFVTCLGCPYEFHDNVYAAAGKLFVVPAKRKNLHFRQISTFTKAGSTPQSPSPYGYHLESRYQGGLPNGLTQNVKKADLASVRVTYRRADADSLGLVTWGDSSRNGFGPGVEMQLPATVTEYVMPGLTYAPSVYLRGRRPQPGYASYPELEMPPRAYKRGKNPAEVWNAAVFVPRLNAWREREYDAFSIMALDPFGAGTGGRYEWERPAGSLTLRQGNQVIARTKRISELNTRLPRAVKRYRLTLDATRLGSANLLSKRATVDWWFTSSRVSTRGYLPLLNIEIPGRALDSSNQAHAGSTLQLPMTVRRSLGLLGPKVTRVTLEASFDGGQTWRKIALRSQAGRWIATIKHPTAPGTVSLRASAWDARNDAVRATLIRAYTTKV